MRKLLVAAGLLLSTSAFASYPSQNGNFRRAEVLKAVGAKDGRVASLAAAKNHVIAPNAPKGARIAIVSHGGKVDLVKAPEDTSREVTRLSERQAKSMGLLTQKEAAKYASSNGGLLGSSKKVRVVNDGLSASGGSYAFKQISPSSKVVKQYKSLYRADKISRTVTIGGNGESASARMTKLGK
jgi:hypothetical protein